MACRKGELREEGKNRRTAAAPSAAVGDALLFATMCIIGMPVDVYAKDGSVYSGIFHTASVDKDYAIVLKKARMIKKGNLDVNVASGSLIETLIVQSEDLVQLVAKGVLLPSNGITEYAGDGSTGAAVGYNDCLHKDVEVVKPNESKGDRDNSNRSSLEEHIERLETLGLEFVKTEEAQTVSVDGGQVQEGSPEMQSDSHGSPELIDKRITNENQGTSLIIEDWGQERLALDETARMVASPPHVSVASTAITDAKSESCLKASSNPFLFVPSKSSSVNRNAKESKLNPGAKIFSPSMLHHRTVSPPAVPNGASVSYVPGTYTMATAQEVEANSFTHSLVPVKLVPYNNAAVGHGGNDAAYVQPIIGQVANRAQPVRFTGQYQNFQLGTAYIHPNSQNVMIGRMGPLVGMHPVPSDVVQNAAGFSPAATRPMLTSYPMHLAKQQGNSSAQAQQLSMSPPVITSGPQQFVMPGPIPISQPVYPVLQPLGVPGSNGFLSTKYA